MAGGDPTGKILHNLANLLRSLSINYKRVTQHEVVLRAPLQLGTTNTQIRLCRQLPQSSTPPPANEFLKEPAPHR